MIENHNDTIARAYPPDTVREIAERHKFDGTDPRWEWTLKRGALRYLRAAAAPARKAQDQAAASRRKTMARLIGELLDCLRTEDGDEMHLALALDAVAREKGIENADEDDFPDFERCWIETVDRLEMLQTAVERERAAIIPAKKGRQENVGLDQFVKQLLTFWEVDLGRPVTLDYHKGQGLTPVFHFVVDAVSPIVSEGEESVITALRKCIAEASGKNRRLS